MSAQVRLTAKIVGHLTEHKVKHYRGVPPELTGGTDHRELLEVPALVVIEERPDGVFLFRFTAAGQIVGDTWHMTVEEAQHQARHEFGDLLSHWVSVPAHVQDQDIVSFGLSATERGDAGSGDPSPRRVS